MVRAYMFGKGGRSSCAPGGNCSEVRGAAFRGGEDCEREWPEWLERTEWTLCRLEPAAGVASTKLTDRVLPSPGRCGLTFAPPPAYMLSPPLSSGREVTCPSGEGMRTEPVDLRTRDERLAAGGGEVADDGPLYDDPPVYTELTDNNALFDGMPPPNSDGTTLGPMPKGGVRRVLPCGGIVE